MSHQPDTLEVHVELPHKQFSLDRWHQPFLQAELHVNPSHSLREFYTHLFCEFVNAQGQAYYELSFILRQPYVVRCLSWCHSSQRGSAGECAQVLTFRVACAAVHEG